MKQLMGASVVGERDREILYWSGGHGFLLCEEVEPGYWKIETLAREEARHWCEVMEMKKIDYTFYPSATVGESNGKTMVVNPYGGLFLKWYDHELGLGRMEELRRADALEWCKENLPVETGYETLFKILEKED